MVSEAANGGPEGLASSNRMTAQNHNSADPTSDTSDRID